MKTPEVLLLGNGLNNAFDGTTWNALIYKMARRKDLPKRIDLPYPLQIFLAIFFKFSHFFDSMTAKCIRKNHYIGKIMYVCPPVSVFIRYDIVVEHFSGIHENRRLHHRRRLCDDTYY